MIEQEGQQRYYVHGDSHEERPDTYFCARCNGQFAAPHFAERFHVQTLAAKLVQSMAGWLRKAADPASNLHRPQDARNLFAEELITATAIARHDEARWAKVAVDRF